MIAHAAMFESVEKAQAAAKAFTDQDFKEDDVLMLEPGDGDKFSQATKSTRWGPTLDGIRNRVRAAMEAGHAVLVVDVPIGRGLLAEEILETHTPAKVVMDEKRGGPLWSAAVLPMLYDDKHRVGPYFKSMTFSSSVLPMLVKGQMDPVFPKTIRGLMDPVIPHGAKGQMDPIFPKIVRGLMDPIFPHISGTRRSKGGSKDS